LQQFFLFWVQINRICEVGLPAIWLPGWHPQVDAALEAGTPYPANHPKIHDSLSHAMPSSHPDIDELLKSGSFAMPANHCKIDPWVCIAGIAHLLICAMLFEVCLGGAYGANSHCVFRLVRVWATDIAPGFGCVHQWGLFFRFWSSLDI